MPGTSEEAIERLCDTINLWSLSAAYTPEVIEAAVDALVAGADSPTLRELAGVSPRESQFELASLIETTLQELGQQHVLTDQPQRAALAAMIRRFKNRDLSARDLARWAHRYIGHDGDASCQVFVDLDDMYDTVDYSDFDEESLDRWTMAEADAFCQGTVGTAQGRT